MLKFQDVGSDILRGIKFNRTLLKLDLRMCKISQETEYAVRQNINANRTSVRLKQPMRNIAKLQKAVEFKEFENEPCSSTTRDVNLEIADVFANSV